MPNNSLQPVHFFHYILFKCRYWVTVFLTDHTFSQPSAFNIKFQPHISELLSLTDYVVFSPGRHNSLQYEFSLTCSYILSSTIPSPYALNLTSPFLKVTKPLHYPHYSRVTHHPHTKHSSLRSLLNMPQTHLQGFPQHFSPHLRALLFVLGTHGMLHNHTDKSPLLLPDEMVMSSECILFCFTSFSLLGCSFPLHNPRL